MADRPRPTQDPPYRVYRARPRLLSGLRGGGPALSEPGPPRAPRAPRERDRRPAKRGGATAPGRLRRPTVKRVIAYLALALVGWLVLSLILFLISSGTDTGVSARTRAALSSGGFPLTSANTILVLGSDLRTPGTKEPGAVTHGPSRSDTLLLLRVGGGHDQRLSIPRDTYVPIPGHGMNKINAAFFFGGAPLAIRTVQDLLGIKVNHVVLINFAKFPKFVDSLGGVDFLTHRRILSLINGGNRNGGFTLRLHRGVNHLDGTQALALARTRENRLDPAENDLTRERRQQQLLNDIKSKLTSPLTLLRLPWVSWNGPGTIRTDMGGPTLLSVAATLATTGGGRTHILTPSGGQSVAGIGDVLTPPDAARRRAIVQRFLNR